MLALPEVVPPTSAYETGGGPTTGTPHNPAAPHGPPISCHQTADRQHDGGNNLPARHLESNQGPPHGLGVHGGPDGSISTTDHRASAPPGYTQAVAGCRACPTSTGRILLIRLLNSSNTCYINASVRAWLFAVSHPQVADILKYGTQEQAWRDLYHARRPLHVHALRSWRPLLRNWTHLHQQQDACEFLEHLLGAGRPQVLQGRWESRMVSDLDAPKPESSTTRTSLSHLISLTLIMPQPYKASSTTGTMEARTCKPVHIPPASYSCDSHAFKTARLAVRSSSILKSISPPRFMSHVTLTHSTARTAGTSHTLW